MPRLNLGRVVSYLNKAFRGIALSLQVNSDVLSRLGYRSILIYNIQIPYSPVIVPSATYRPYTASVVRIKARKRQDLIYN